MATNRVHFVDVFAQGKYTGNQLAVVRDASNLSTDEMLAFTRETNFSEATFIESSDGIGVEVGGRVIPVLDGELQ